MGLTTTYLYRGEISSINPKYQQDIPVNVAHPVLRFPTWKVIIPGSTGFHPKFFTVVVFPCKKMGGTGRKTTTPFRNGVLVTFFRGEVLNFGRVRWMDFSGGKVWGEKQTFLGWLSDPFKG